MPDRTPPAVEGEHREDCDCHECERGELRRQFYNDAIGRWPHA